jgi:hypothetical protein
MKNPGKARCFSARCQTRKCPAEGFFMEKIVLVSKEPKKVEHMIPLIEALFPECTVEVVPEWSGELGHRITHFEEETFP